MSDAICPSCGRTLKEEGYCEYCGYKKSVEEIDPFYNDEIPADKTFVDEVIPYPIKEHIKQEKIKKSERTHKTQTPIYLIPGIAVIVCIALLGLAVMIILPGLFPTDHPSTTYQEITPSPTEISELNTTNISHNRITNDSEGNRTLNTSPILSDSSLLTDDFSDKKNRWGEYNDGSFLKYYDQGSYHMIQKGENMTGMALLGGDYANFYSSVETNLLSGPLTGSYGILFRYTNGDWYSFGINGRGWYSVKKQVNGVTYDLIPQTEVYLLNKGYANNTLGVQAEGSTLRFYINGRIIREITDTSISHGDIGLFVSRHTEKGYIGEEGVHVAFDNFRMRS